ncbi:MAG: hypothetical protein JSU87_01750 [Gemmatimonadota bacterium]|nr:MAG: hypothetical protein JSU87_01750 [Gemmatimonadota bacterium]
MPESRSVNLVVNLPVELADEVERVHESDPEFVERVLVYGLVRRAVFARLQSFAALHRPSPASLESSIKSSLELT